jgi:hypothetical protein
LVQFDNKVFNINFFFPLSNKNKNILQFDTIINDEVSVIENFFQIIFCITRKYISEFWADRQAIRELMGTQ